MNGIGGYGKMFGIDGCKRIGLCLKVIGVVFTSRRMICVSESKLEVTGGAWNIFSYSKFNGFLS